MARDITYASGARKPHQTGRQIMARRKKKFSLFRFIRKTIVTLLVLIGLALAALYLMPADKIAGIAAARFEAATGRAMVLEGDVRPSIWPQLGVKTGHVSIANADWSDAGPMLEADSLAVGVDMAALIRGQIKITKVVAVAPKILAEVNAEGQGNWQFDSAATEGTGSGGTSTTSARSFTLDRADVTDGQLTFINHQTGDRHELTGLDATVTLPDYAGPAQIKASAILNGQPLTIDTTIAAFATFLDAGQSPVKLAATIGSARASFDGQAGLSPLAASGVLDADLADLSGPFAALGMAKPALPGGIGKAVAMSGDVTYGADAINLRGATLKIDKNRLVGSVDLSLAGKPKLTGNFSAGALDLSTLGGSGAQGGGTSASAGSGWSKVPIDVSGLAALDADVTIEADSVALSTARLGRTRITATIDNSRAVLTINELAAFDGAVDGSFVINGRKGVSVGTNLEGRAIALKPLLSQLAGYDRLVAAGNLTVNAVGAGNSMDALMNSLNGDGTFSIGAGELLGLDLVGMIQHLDTSFVGKGAKTIFDSITGTFTIQNGVLKNGDLALNSPLLSATGKGEVGLGGQTLNFRLMPTLTAAGKTVSVPLLITGTWANPKFALDIKSLADAKLADEKAKLADKAKAAAEQAVTDKLGVTAVEGQSTKDAIKQELKKKAADGLLNLLSK